MLGTILFITNLFEGWDGIIIIVVILLLFGGKKIPELAKGLGKGIHDFKKAYKEGNDENQLPEGKPEEKK
ncbi:MAG: twin-arginine translocase TatA/TatE family subunit [Bacteroidota bacterium]